MARIDRYKAEPITEITDSDILLGMDTELQSTRKFPISALADYFSGVIPGRIIRSINYDPDTGRITITFSEGDPLVTDDLRGAQGEQGPQGPMGAPGTDGRDGAPGADGRDGAQGPVGPIGPMGLPGMNGTDGAPGRDGDDGQSVDRAMINEDGDVVFFVGDLALTPLNLTGPQGPAGPAGTDGRDGMDGMDGAQGPQGNGVTGYRVDTDGDVVFQSNGVDLIGPPVDLTGPAGPQGIPGQTGPMGSPGRDGANGADGQDGLDVSGYTQNADGDIIFENANGPIGDPVDLTGPQGPQGPAGMDGMDGTNGTNGTDGADGESAYEIWRDAGNTFNGGNTQQDFLDSLVGPQGTPGRDGTDGTDGMDGTDGADGTSVVGYRVDADGDVIFQGPDGDLAGTAVDLTGPQGPAGPQGDDAYDVWVENGNTFNGGNSEDDFLASLVGPQGPRGEQGEMGDMGDMGFQGRFYEYLYLVATDQPETPTADYNFNGMELENISGGWSETIPATLPDGQFVWEARGEVRPDDVDSIVDGEQTVNFDPPYPIGGRTETGGASIGGNLAIFFNEENESISVNANGSAITRTTAMGRAAGLEIVILNNNIQIADSTAAAPRFRVFTKADRLGSDLSGLNATAEQDAQFRRQIEVMGWSVRPVNINNILTTANADAPFVLERGNIYKLIDAANFVHGIIHVQGSDLTADAYDNIPSRELNLANNNEDDVIPAERTVGNLLLIPDNQTNNFDVLFRTNRFHEGLLPGDVPRQQNIEITRGHATDTGVVDDAGQIILRLQNLGSGGTTPTRPNLSYLLTVTLADGTVINPGSGNPSVSLDRSNLQAFTIGYRNPGAGWSTPTFTSQPNVPGWTVARNADNTEITYTPTDTATTGSHRITPQISSTYTGETSVEHFTNHYVNLSVTRPLEQGDYYYYGTSTVEATAANIQNDSITITDIVESSSSNNARNAASGVTRARATGTPTIPLGDADDLVFIAIPNTFTPTFVNANTGKIETFDGEQQIDIGSVTYNVFKGAVDADGMFQITF